MVERKISEFLNIVPGAESERAEGFAKYIIDAADQVFLIKDTSSRKIPFSPWWIARCVEAERRRKVAEREYTQDMSDENLQILQNNINSTFELLREKKQQNWKTLCSSLSPNTCP